MTNRPVLVARAPRRLPPATLIRDAASVAVLAVKGPAPPGVLRPDQLGELGDWLVVAIVTTVPFAAGDSSPAFGPPPRVVPSDLVPWRSTTDVILRGGAAAGPVSLRVGGLERRFVAAGPGGRVDLHAGLFTSDGVPATSRVPAPPALEGGLRWFDEADHEGAHAAAPALRWPRLRGDEDIVLTTAAGHGRVALPGVVPRLRVLGATLDMPDQELWADLQEVLVDVDGGRARLVFRALVATTRADGRDVDRIDVLFQPPPAGPEEPFDDHDVPRAEFEHAWDLDRAEAGTPPPPLEAQELEIARYESWDHAGPFPVLPLPQAAAVAAELAEQREARDAVLARHGLDRYAWEVEERAWAEAAATPPEADDQAPSIAQLWSEAFQDAQARLARPEERARTAADYARIAVALEGPAPDRAFADNGIGLGAYQRLDRRMQAEAASDPAFASELEALLAQERAAARSRRAEDRFAGVDVEEEDEG